MDTLRRIANQLAGINFGDLTDAEGQIFEILCERGLVVYDEITGEIITDSQPERFKELQEKAARAMKGI